MLYRTLVYHVAESEAGKDEKVMMGREGKAEWVV